jgi:8-oxo-dGTP diphosphatase
MASENEIRQGKNGPFVDLYPNSDYDPTEYERPGVTVDTCICRFNYGQLQIHLVEREDEQLAIPGVFVRVKDKEDIDTAAARTLASKVNISDNTFIRQLATYGDPDRDSRWRIITVAYYALVRYEDTLETDELNWVNVNDATGLAFDHDEIVDDLLDRLASNIKYEPIAFELLPELFTWSEAQMVYEKILNKELVTPNFRRKVAAQYELEELDEKKKLDVGRPAVQMRYLDIRNPFE